MAGRPKGLPRTGGRKKGQPNKVTRDLREAVLAAFESVGGPEYLVGQAHDNPQAFMTLLGKCMPAQVAAALTGKIDVNVTHIRRDIVDPRNPNP